MEVAGVVLGGLPLAINALRQYRSFITSLKNVQRDLDSIIRCLRTQQRILENTCEALLQGIVPQLDITTMITKPFDSLWTKYEGRIKLRLDQDWDIFQGTAKEMKTIVDDLQAKLALNKNGKSSIRDRASFIANLKEGVRFTLRIKDYKGLIAALNEGNNTLRILVLQSKELEPCRDARGWTRFVRGVQQVTGGMYASLCASVNCKCACAHGFGLELHSPTTNAIKWDWSTTDPIFGLAFGSNRAKSTECWAQFYAALVSNKSRPPCVPPMPQAPLSRAESSEIGQISARGVIHTAQNNPLTNSTSTITCRTPSSALDSGSQAGPSSNIPQIQDLCGEFVEEKKDSKEKWFGFVTDNKTHFYLSHKSCNPAGLTFITLREILCRNHPQFPRLDYSQKARLAYTLSVNLLSLVTTPWLDKALNLDGIAFFRAADGLNGWVYHLDRVFLPKDIATPTSAAGLSCGHPTHLPSDKYKPLTILSLACLLVQIMLGHSMEDFHIAEKSCLGCLMTQQAAASRKLGAVLAKGGDMYADAVNWCLQNYLSAVNLDDGEFDHRYYSKVVLKLEALVDVVGCFSAS